MKLILVRHGQTFANIGGITQGHLDSDLTPEGMKQTIAVAEYLKSQEIDSIYSSDLLRTKKTAEAINKFHNKKIIYNKILRERYCGIFEGRPSHEFKQGLTESGLDFLEFKAEGCGESAYDLINRVIPYIENLIKINRDKTILVVTHGGPMLELYFHFLNFPRSSKEDRHKNRPPNCGVTILEFSKKEDCKILEFNIDPAMEKSN